MWVNVLLGVQLDQCEAFLNNWRFDQDGNRLANDFAPYQTNSETPAIDVYDPHQVRVPMTAQGLWKNKTQGAVGNHKQLVTMNVRAFTEPDWTDPQDPDPKTILTIIHYLRETFPGAIQVLDVFKSDGDRYEIDGQPVYQPNPKADMLLYMPGGVDYEQVNLSMGWQPRKYE